MHELILKGCALVFILLIYVGKEFEKKRICTHV